MVAKDGGNTFRQAASLGTAVLRPGALAQIEVSNAFTPGSGETVDWFRFRVRGRAASQLASTTVVLAADRWLSSLTLYRAAGRRPGRVLARLDSVNSVRQIKALTQGNYFLKLSGSAPPAANTFEGGYVGRVQMFTPPTLFQ